jgi:hypothetical protein
MFAVSRKELSAAEQVCDGIQQLWKVVMRGMLSKVRIPRGSVQIANSTFFEF